MRRAAILGALLLAGCGGAPAPRSLEVTSGAAGRGAQLEYEVSG